MQEHLHNFSYYGNLNQISVNEVEQHAWECFLAKFADLSQLSNDTIGGMYGIFITGDRPLRESS